MDIKLLPARIDDLKRLCAKSNSPKFIGFLTADELAVGLKQFKFGDKHSHFGGYDGAERVMLGILPEWCDKPDFPIKAITFTYRACDRLTHRDFLGALMALGINRETIGDILVGEGRAVAFVSDDISKFVFSGINKIGNVGVTLTEGFCEPLPQGSKKQSLVVTVASTRLDCVVAALCGISRKEATEKIADGYVSINSSAVIKTTANIKADDKIAVRKKGKFEITACDEHSKKGRIILKYDKYL
ncbi:MAG: hypothetical protein IJY79_00720 [Clostridia bacterium]|nr:hypothetical protein [Clostridia bacterium]